jgi:hypothetical protein
MYHYFNILSHSGFLTNTEIFILGICNKNIHEEVKNIYNDKVKYKHEFATSMPLLNYGIQHNLISRDKKSIYKYAAVLGNVSILYAEYDMLVTPLEIRCFACIIAAKYGNIKFLQHMLQIEDTDDTTTRNSNVILNNLDAFETKMIDKLYNMAAWSGNLKVILWFRQKGITTENFDIVFMFASIQKHNNILEWIKENSINVDHQTRENPYTAAISCGQLEIIKKLHELEYPLENYFTTEALAYKQDEILKWFLDKGCTWGEHTFNIAVRTQSVECLTMLLETGCVWDEHVFTAAVYGKNWEVVNWLKNNGCPMGPTAWETVIRSNDTQDIKRFMELGCPFDEFSCSAAAATGNLEVLQWLHEQGCPWDYRVTLFAAANNHVDLLNWALAAGCEYEFH